MEEIYHQLLNYELTEEQLQFGQIDGLFLFHFDESVKIALLYFSKCLQEDADFKKRIYSLVSENKKPFLSIENICDDILYPHEYFEYIFLKENNNNRKILYQFHPFFQLMKLDFLRFTKKQAISINIFEQIKNLYQT